MLIEFIFTNCDFELNFLCIYLNLLLTDFDGKIVYNTRPATPAKIYIYETVIIIPLPRLVQKSPTFGKSYSTRNSLPRLVQKSPTFGESYSTRNSLPRLVHQKS